MLKFLKPFSSALLIGMALFMAGARSHEALAANVPAGFTETLIPPPNGGAWNEAVGVTFSATGRMFVWERPGRIWFKDPGETNFTQLLDISEEVGDWGDSGCLGFAVDPQFQVNGNIYLLYVVDRHHLLYYGTGNYNSSSNLYNQATIGRLTRYTCTPGNNFRSVNLASRTILIGETKTNGIPICSYVHLVGSLVFGQDGTLLISTGDAASPEATDTGGARQASYAPQALTDGIIRPKEDVGAYRSQLVDCLDGKVLRVDPATGNGVASNPFYDATKPRSAKSRVWTVGVRQPFRMTIRPNSGSHDPADGQPGVLYIGEVGWDNTESLKLVTGPGQNLGWPLFEGLELTPTFSDGLTYNTDVYNQDAPNPLYPGSGCSQYFSFRQLLKQDTTNAANLPPFNNPCNGSVKIPSSIPQFLYKRPILDWNHANPITRTPVYGPSGQAIATNIGVAGSPVSGTQFKGNCSVAGTWYTGTAFPAQYQNKYFHVDWGQGLIKCLTLTTNDKPLAVDDFASAGGAIVCLTQHPTDGSMYYVTYNLGDAGTLRQLSYTGNRTPVAVASSDVYYGPGPLTVQFSSNGSSDPDAQTLSYSWNFGDGTPVSTAANPSHVFTAPGGSTPTNYTVTLTVTDSGGLPANATLNIAVNDTPPSVAINSPTNGMLYTLASNSTYNLTATVSDVESPDNKLQYVWQSILHHNDHNHVVGTSTNHASSFLLEPIGCDGVNMYYYRVVLTVTDPRGLATVREVDLFPNCGTTDTPPTISNITNQTTQLSATIGPIPFTIGDAQVAAANLQLSAGSSNPTLVPTNNIVFGGFGANRTVTITPAPSLNGTSTISIYVNDGPNTVTGTFQLAVIGSNTPPTISSIPNQAVGEGTPAAVAFTVNDANTPAGTLVLSGASSNPTLVPANNFIFGGSGSNRTLTVIPAAGITGTATLTVAVSDGALSVSNDFTLTVTSLPAGGRSVTNATAITIPDASPASIYPSVINVSGLGGAITNVTVTLRGLSHGWGRDIDALLVGPGGQRLMFMSDAGTGPTVTNGNLTFSDSAASFLPQTGYVAAGTYKPTDYEPGDGMPAPAPAGPYATNLAVFNGQIANGAWSLYVVDDGPTDAGSIGAGWSLTLMTAAVSAQPPSISAIPDQQTPFNTPTAALPFTITDSDTPLGNLILSKTSSNPALVPTNNIVFGGSGSNRTVTITPVTGQTGNTTISIFVSDGTNISSDTFVLTVNPLPPPIQSFTNATAIAILDNGPSSPYPSIINVTGLTGAVSDVTITLRGLSHQWGRDIDALLVGPGGQKVMFMSDAGTFPTETNANFTFSDNAAAYLPAAGNLLGGTYKPTDYTNLALVADVMPAPAPAGPYATNLSAFSNQVANGTWSLYVLDDGAGETGSIAGGWSLTITTQPITDTNVAPTISSVSNQLTLVNTPTPAIPFTIFDVETAASNLVLSAVSSNPGLVPTNNIFLNGSGTNWTVTVSPTSNQLGNATIGLRVSDGTATTSNSFVLTVNPALLTVTENSFSRGYGATNPMLTGSVTGLQAGDNITAGFSTAALTNSPIGTYPIVVTLSDPDGKLGNYIITTNNGALTVTNALLTVTGNSFSRGYGATNPVLTGSVNGLQAGDDITAGFGAAALTNSPVGIYPIAVTLADPGGRLGNYLITTNNGTLTVTNALLTMTGNSFSRPYGATNPVLTGSMTGICPGDSVTASFTTLARTNSPVGIYPISITFSDPGGKLGNYLVHIYPGTLTVGAASLLITAGSTNKVYGTALYPTAFGVAGLKNGDQVNSVTLGSAGCVSNAPVGSHDIVPSGALGIGLTNYSVGYSNGTLTVGAANLLVAARSTNKVYGATLNPSVFAATGLLNGDNITNVIFDSPGCVSNAPVGSYAINVVGALGVGLTNYSMDYSNGTLIVMPALLVATADNQARAYGQPNPVFTVSYSGFVNGENANVLDVLPEASSSATSTSAPGSYPITTVGGSDDNYVLSRVNGTLTIGAPGPVMITSARFVPVGSLRIVGAGDANVNYKIEASSDLVSWTEIGTAPSDGSGAFEYVDVAAGDFTARYYRVATP